MLVSTQALDEGDDKVRAPGRTSKPDAGIVIYLSGGCGICLRPEEGTEAILGQMNLKALNDHRTVSLIRETVDEWVDDKALQLSAALAYYSVFSIAPLLVIAISVAGLVFGPDAVRGHLDDELKGYIGAKAAEGVQTMVQSVAKPSEGWIATATGFVTLMLGASGVFGQLKDSLNTIWDVRAPSKGGIMIFLRARLLSFGMVLVIGFLLLTSLLLTTALTGLSGYLARYIDVPVFVWGAAGFLLSMLVVTLLFALIFKVLPDTRIAWRDVWMGALVTSLLFEIGKFALSLYLGRETTASGYGAAGAVVLLLLWVYYTSCILLLGAEFTQVYARRNGRMEAVRLAAAPLTPERLLAQPGVDVATPRLLSRHDVQGTASKRTEFHPAGALLLITALSCMAGLWVSRRR